MEPSNTNPTNPVNHKRWSVIMAFALPMLLILGVLVSSQSTLFKAESAYDFVYAVCDIENTRYYYDKCDGYLIDVVQVDEEGKFYRGEVNPKRDSDNDGVLDVDESFKIRFFYHDNQTNSSREITESELEQYKLSSLLSSPDGASVEYVYQRGGDVLFFDVGSGGYEYQLVNGNRTKTLNIITGTDRYYYRDNNFAFIGWVITQ